MFSFSPNKLIFDSSILLTIVVIVFFDLAKTISLLLGIITYSNLIKDLDLDEDMKRDIYIFIRFFYLSLALFSIRLFLKKREADLEK
jgi:hypothetical protein